jgi:hypothetical protein
VGHLLPEKMGTKLVKLAIAVLTSGKRLSGRMNPNPTTVSYNAGVAKFYKARNSVPRF